jgi:hypothetical protein
MDIGTNMDTYTRYINVNARIDIKVYVYTYICTYIHTYTHTHIQYMGPYTK